MVCKEENVVINKKKHNKGYNVYNVLEPGTVAPDGGWGWLVVAASGLNNVFCLSLINCFGMIFRDSFQHLEISAFQTTALISINSAVASFVGLSNGPLFRKYSYRQVACVGGFLAAISIIALAFAKTYYAFLIFFSILYATGKSISMSANALALITYFKGKRQIAVGLSWAFSGAGSIMTPQITAVLMSMYGMFGTTLIFGGFALNSLVCGLILQPVRMHAKKDTGCKDMTNAAKTVNTKEDEEVTGGTDKHGPGKMFPLTNVKQWDKLANIVEKKDDTTTNLLKKELPLNHEEVKMLEGNKLSWCARTFHTVGVMFDLDLLQDYVLINLLIGCSLTVFVEVNFIFLTPYVLMDFGLNHSEVATVISVLSGVDVFTRIVAAFVANRIGWSNRTFMLIGIATSVLGRVVLAHVSTFNVILANVVVCGIGKALVLVFTNLVLPDYVPLEKMPGAHGLSLMFRGIVFLALGPIIGQIRDISGDNTAMLYFLNLFNILVIISWLLESCCHACKRRRQQQMKDPRV